MEDYESILDVQAELGFTTTAWLGRRPARAPTVDRQAIEELIERKIRGVK